MRRYILCALLCSSHLLLADSAQTQQSVAKGESFTGKVLKNRVRMRLHPSLDAYVFTELNKDDFLLITDQVEDFYACVPPKEVKGYIFRTYVLDGVVEGANVNVRLEPDTNAPVITQLHTGDRVQGIIAPQNNKWLQIELPSTVKFYVAKELISKAGSANLYTERQQRLQDVQRQLNGIEAQLEEQLQKPFPEIELSPLVSQLTKICMENKDLPQEVQVAQALVTKMQENYLAKSLEYRKQPPEETPQAEQPIEVAAAAEESKPALSMPAVVAATGTFKDQEAVRVQQAISQGLASSEEQFYANELKTAVSRKGIIKPYQSYAKNRPGDYLLIDEKTQLPIAYLYSMHVDLKNYVNQEVSLQVASRPNNHFAFPAFIVLKVGE